MHSLHSRIIMITRVIVILIYVNYRTVTCERNHTIGKVYIDDVTNTYLDIEQQLWTLFASKSNQSELVLSIHRKHLHFFQNSFSIERRRTESHKSNFEKLFGWEAQSLNSEIDFVKNFGLHDSFDDISEYDTVQMAESYIRYSTIMANIYNRTMDTNLFDHIKQVLCKFCLRF